MPFYIKPFPGQTYGPRYARHDDIKAYFGFGRLITRKFWIGQAYEEYQTLVSSKVPVDFKDSRFLQTTDGRTVWVTYFEGHKSTIGMRGKSSKHRVTVLCPDCMAEVPVGRTHQHKCK